jgi:GntR family transcriptional repressor for pyruvate dehydrogenase complex
MTKKILVQKKKLYEELIDQFSTLLENGGYAVGDKLPSLTELAEIFGVGKASLREALSVLNAAGVIEMRHGSGIYLRKLVEKTQEEVLIQLNTNLDNDQMIHWLELRRAIEVEAAGLAAKRRTEEDIACLEKIYQEMEQRILNGIDAGEVEETFHSQVAKAAHNPVLARAITSTSEIIRKQYFDVSHKNLLAIPSRGENVNHEHQRILEAIKAKKENEARSAMLQHIQNAIQKHLFVHTLIREGKSLANIDALFRWHKEEVNDNE